MKKIDITKMMIANSYNDSNRKEILGMEFIKQKDGNYLIKNSNGRVVSEKEKLQLENKELVLEDIEKDCAKEITKKISKNKKRIQEIETIEEKEDTQDASIEETEPIKK